MSIEIRTQVVVLGAGPAGYSAAFRCADLGLKTVIVERYNTLGGVCLNVGCIPSKALLHVAKIIKETEALNKYGVVFGSPKISIDEVRSWKERIIDQLTNGLDSMARSRNIKIINGIAKFTGINAIEVKNRNEKIVINFSNAIIAAGSSSIQMSCIPYNSPRVWDSTKALKLREIPNRMLIIGGGIIGLEMGTVYRALGTEIDLVEVSDQVIPVADKDIIRTFTRCIENDIKLMLETKVISVEEREDGIYVSMEGKAAPIKPQRYDVILVAIGREPNSRNINADKIGIKVNDHGFIVVDKQLRTSVSHIFAVGDIVGQPMLAHKGIYEGHVAAEVISGMKRYFDPIAIPSIVYTDPEVAWVGLTEKEAKKKGIIFEQATFRWNAFGRALVSNCADGITKLIFDKKTHRILGGAVVGTNGSEILSEISLAIEMGCDSEDIALTVHAHPTFYESIGLTAEIFEGTVTDLLNIKAKK